jgi:hypothetical protein
MTAVSKSQVRCDERDQIVQIETQTVHKYAEKNSNLPALSLKKNLEGNFTPEVERSGFKSTPYVTSSTGISWRIFRHLDTSFPTSVLRSGCSLLSENI